MYTIAQKVLMGLIRFYNDSLCIFFIGMERLCPPRLFWTKLPTSAKVGEEWLYVLEIIIPQFSMFNLQ